MSRRDRSAFRSASATALSLLALLALPVSLAGAAATPPELSGLTAWTAAGSRVAFVASAVDGRRGYLWVESFGSDRPRLLRDHAPIGEEEIDQLAAGPNGTWGSLERTVGNTGSYYAVDLVSSRGGGTQVATAGSPTGTSGGPSGPSIPQVVGDGSFLGYLHVTSTGVVQLYRITPKGRGMRIANLVGATDPQEAALANGTLAIRERDGSVAVYTTGGRPLATIPAHAASVALTSNRVVVRTTARRLVVYGLHGGLVHDWPLAVRRASGLAANGRYALYLGANKAVHVVRLSNGGDRIVARAGAGWFWGGLSLQAKGAVVPLTTRHDNDFPATFRFLPVATLERAVR